jgi:hypothetical protein
VRSSVGPAGSAMMEHAEPPEVSSRLYPCSNLSRIRNTWIVNLKRSQAYPVLQRELDVGMMQLKARLLSSAGRRRARRTELIQAVTESYTLTYVAPGSRPGLAVVSIEISVMRIADPSRVRGEMDDVMMALQCHMGEHTFRHALNIGNA